MHPSMEMSECFLHRCEQVKKLLFPARTWLFWHNKLRHLISLELEGKSTIFFILALLCSLPGTGQKNQPLRDLYKNWQAKKHLLPDEYDPVTLIQGWRLQ